MRKKQPTRGQRGCKARPSKKKVHLAEATGSDDSVSGSDEDSDEEMSLRELLKQAQKAIFPT